MFVQSYHTSKTKLDHFLYALSYLTLCDQRMLDQAVHLVHYQLQFDQRKPKHHAQKEIRNSLARSVSMHTYVPLSFT